MTLPRRRDVIILKMDNSVKFYPRFNDYVFVFLSPTSTCIVHYSNHSFVFMDNSSCQ